MGPAARRPPVYDRTHFEAMQQDHRRSLSLHLGKPRFSASTRPHSRVLSVRPCIRIGYDGSHFTKPSSSISNSEDPRRASWSAEIEKPDGMPDHRRSRSTAATPSSSTNTAMSSTRIGNSIFNPRRHSPPGCGISGRTASSSGGFGLAPVRRHASGPDPHWGKVADPPGISIGLPAP